MGHIPTSSHSPVYCGTPSNLIAIEVKTTVQLPTSLSIRWCLARLPDCSITIWDI